MFDFWILLIEAVERLDFVRLSVFADPEASASRERKSIPLKLISACSGSKWVRTLTLTPPLSRGQGAG
jgi:hypothetical protein